MGLVVWHRCWATNRVPELKDALFSRGVFIKQGKIPMCQMCPVFTYKDKLVKIAETFHAIVYSLFYDKIMLERGPFVGIGQ